MQHGLSSSTLLISACLREGANQSALYDLNRLKLQCNLALYVKQSSIPGRFRQLKSMWVFYNVLHHRPDFFISQVILNSYIMNIAVENLLNNGLSKTVRLFSTMATKSRVSLKGLSGSTLELATIYLQKTVRPLILKSRANTNDSDADDHCLVDNEGQSSLRRHRFNL